MWMLQCSQQQQSVSVFRLQTQQVEHREHLETETETELSNVLELYLFDRRVKYISSSLTSSEAY